MREHEQSVALHQYLQSIIINIPFGIITIAKDLDIAMLNDIALDLLGFEDQSPSEFIDIPYMKIFKNTPKIQEKFEAIILKRQARKFDIEKFKFENSILNIKCRTTLYGTLFIIENITSQAELEDELQYQVNHDSLTNLINRKELEKRLEQFGEKHHENGLVGAIVFIDLDRFKPVNDIAGHAAGDKLLKNITKIMQRTIRDRDTLARVGGDEFVILLENCPLSRVISITEKIRKEIDEYLFEWEGNTFSIGISAGISIITNELKSVNEAINLADQACLIAKNEGRNRIHIADDSLQESKQYKEEISWINIIHNAIKNNDFVLFAQKIQEIQKKPKISHYELLLRLKNEKGEYLSPSVFMPSAERYELMLRVDEWVVENAFKSIQKNQHFSINLSGQTMSNPDFADFIIKHEKKHSVNPSQITFEITETMAIKYFKNTKEIMNTLLKRGYNFSLDDFGTGLSSYEYLKKMPVSYLKIDGIFIKEIVTDEVSYAMVKSIHDIGKVMGIKTIAEFVENKNIFDKLKEIGIDYAQGYYVHKPENLHSI